MEAVDSKLLAEEAIPLREVAVFCCPWVSKEVSHCDFAEIKRRKQKGSSAIGFWSINGARKVRRRGRPDL